MITNISITSVFVKDVDESKRFYIDILGFEEKDDISLGDGYRWCTVNHPDQPELAVHLTLPGPPHSPEMVEQIQRALDEGGMHGLSSWRCRSRSMRSRRRHGSDTFASTVVSGRST